MIADPFQSGAVGMDHVDVGELQVLPSAVRERQRRAAAR